jgi:uncharacterized protein
MIKYRIRGRHRSQGHHRLALAVLTALVLEVRHSGPLFIDFDMHALSKPAFKSAREVLAGNGVDLMIKGRRSCNASSIGRKVVEAVETEIRPPLPPFSLETAIKKVRAAEDAWNTREPERVALAYTADSRWRNRSEFLVGREQIVAFLRRKWTRELDYRLIKELWAFRENRIAVRFAYEWHDDSGNWFRSYGNENWEFNEHGLMTIRHASINDLLIREQDRKYHWPLGRRPDDHPGLSSFGF